MIIDRKKIKAELHIRVRFSHMQKQRHVKGGSVYHLYEKDIWKILHTRDVPKTLKQ